MSKRVRAFGPAVHNRRKPFRKGIPQHFLGGVAVTGLVLGCAWTVYTNVLGASVYPSVNSAAFEAPVVRNPTVVAAHSVQPAFNEIFASLPQQSLVIPAPENVASSLMFSERFAAASPQGEPSRSIEPRPVEAAKLADASPQIHARNPRQQTAFPDDDRRHVEDGVAPLVAIVPNVEKPFPASWRR